MGLITKLFGTYSERELKSIYPIVDKIEAMADEYRALTDEELRAKTPEFKARLANGETLDDILPEAFAAVREAAGRVLGLYPYRVQLIGGIVLHQGRIAEMKTGEGKTLVATLPAYLNALTGNGVHIVTVNDYLAKRDSEWMGKVHRFLGLSVGLIVHDLTSDERRAAYAADITYGTNNEMGFDYLRDNMALFSSELVQRGHAFAIVDEVDSILIDEARTPLIISGIGQKSTEMYSRTEALVARFRKKVIAETDEKEEEDVNVDADYIVDEKAKTATLTARGIAKAEQYFEIENLSDPENSTIAHHINQAIKAHGTMKRDIDYVVKDGEVVIVDEFTGRLMFGRRYSEGLHQAIEAKEHVTVARESKTLATITFQNYFRLYKKLSGMTGTALTEEEEFGTIYNLDIIEIPTNRPIARIDDPDVVYKTEAAKYRAVIAQVKECHAKGQPVLVGTVSIEKNEHLSYLLSREGIKHNLLNAKNHEKEAEIVAQAGKLGAVTVATNMAGRGTDIKLGEGVADLGGLFVLGTERHESRRIDRQLRGRCSRQGDPGASQFFISFEDDLMRNFGAAERMTKMMERLGVADGEALEHSFLNKSVESAQKRVEQRNYMWRKHVLDYDDVMNKQREIVYGYRNEVLSTENPREMIYDILEEVIATRAHEFLDPDAEGVTHPDELLAWMNASFPLGLTAEAAKLEERPIDDTIAFLIDKVKATYEDKASRERPEYLDHMERQIILGAIDKMWQEHLYNMDSLREGVRLRAQGQKDPLVEYKSEAYDLFITLMESIKSEAISNLFKSTTNLDAFEDFLASLPQFESSDENQEGGTSLPEIGFDGMPSDLLSALREQVSRAREQQSARQAEPEQAPAVISDATTIGEGYKPAAAEPKLVMPKRKVSVVLRKEEAPQAPAETPVPGEGEEIAVTLDSQDFAETMDNRDSADTRTF